MTKEELRTTAAIAFGQAIISGLSYRPSEKDTARMAVEYADALIEELNK